MSEPSCGLPPDLVEERDELVLVAGQGVLLGALEARGALGEEAVADRVAEQRPLG